ncbi:hypothetical protein [Sediminibacterium goheungense]|uniref:Uncharacterized protein n=1 Tax=Sediminibacterium goheungense TaxID=1086393 RepID=A0A4R6J0G7_9BACT|nr:hypothetical protein [Sediminibacterium goheungense]TDO28231.1 hypothetical protein BC659_0294 [Sediminibacterium goheungense]
MFIRRSDIDALKALSSTSDMVNVGSIPETFKDEFDKYFFGKTLVKKQDALFAYPNDIRQWVIYIVNRYNA